MAQTSTGPADPKITPAHLGGLPLIVPEVTPGQYLWGGGPRNRPLKFVWQDAVLASRLKPASILAVLLALSARADSDGIVRVSIPQLAAVMGDTASRRTIERAISEGLAAGWVKQVQRGGSTIGATTYLLSIPEGFTWPVVNRSVATEVSRTSATEVSEADARATTEVAGYPDPAATEVSELATEVSELATEASLGCDRSGGPLNRSNSPLTSSNRKRASVFSKPSQPWLDDEPGELSASEIAAAERAEWKAEEAHHRMLRDEGLDRSGEPEEPSSSPARQGSRYARSDT